jgi:hypothetical protein
LSRELRLEDAVMASKRMVLAVHLTLISRSRTCI